MNIIKPDTIKEIRLKNIPYYQRENIQSYLKACRELGLKNTDLFETSDLFEEKNINLVIFLFLP